MELGEKKTIHIPLRAAAPSPDDAVPPASTVIPAVVPAPVVPEPPVVAPELEETAALPFIPPAVQTLTPLRVAPDPVRPPRELEPEAPKPFVSRNMVLLVSAAAGLIILGTYLAHRGAKAEAPRASAQPEAAVEHLDLSELSALPEPLKPGAQAVMAGAFQLPQWFNSLEPASGGELDYPVQEAVEEVQPTLRWPTTASF